MTYDLWFTQSIIHDGLCDLMISWPGSYLQLIQVASATISFLCCSYWGFLFASGRSSGCQERAQQTIGSKEQDNTRSPTRNNSRWCDGDGQGRAGTGQSRAGQGSSGQKEGQGWTGHSRSRFLREVALYSPTACWVTSLCWHYKLFWFLILILIVILMIDNQSLIDEWWVMSPLAQVFGLESRVSSQFMLLL